MLQDDAPEVLQLHQVTGKVKDWKTCRKVHDQVRRGIQAKYGLTVPSVNEFWESASVHAKGTMTPREIDLLSLHWWVCKNIMHIDPAQHDWFWDVGYSMTAAKFVKSPLEAGHVSCLLCSHKVYSTARQRVVTGKEQLMMQGFPSSMDTCDLSDSQLRHMSGDTITVVVAAAMKLLMMSNTKLRAEPLSADLRELALDAENMTTTATWVGKKRFAVDSTELDNLEALAVIGKGKGRKQGRKRAAPRGQPRLQSFWPQRAA